MAGNTVTPSSITAGQIGKIQDNLAAALRKSGLPSEPTQQVLSSPQQANALNAELVAVIRKRVDAVSDMIVRRVKVDRSRTPEGVLNATGRKQYTDKEVVKSMPRGESDEEDVYFFKPSPDAYDKNGLISDESAEKELDLRGLKAVDPYKLAQVNIDDPSFGDDHPNCTHWKGADGKWCYAAFSRWLDERDVVVSRNAGVWSGDWWVAGLRK